MSFQFPNFMRFTVPFSDAIARNAIDRNNTDQQSIAEVGKALWRELFLSVFTQNELADWRKKIPKYGCPCADFYAAYERDNPPTFPLSFRWKYDLKSAVNAKLSHPNLSYEDAFKFWNVADRSADHS